MTVLPVRLPNVVTAPFLDEEGRELIVALDRMGKRVEERAVAHPAEKDRLVAELWELIERVERDASPAAGAPRRAARLQRPCLELVPRKPKPRRKQ